MRGGRNKFGPMYKRDRALKQQKKALIRANGLKLEAMTQVIQAMPTDLTISSAIQNIHSASKGLPLNHTALPPTDYDRSPFVTSPISMTMPPHGSLQGYQTYGHFPSRAIKSEYPDPYTSSPESIMGYSYMDGYQTSSPASIPHLILELLKCEPDEPQVQAKIMAYLQQEQANRSKHEKLNTFGLMCKMADQTLFSIVEWARSSIFFRELKVDDQMKLLQNCWSELLILDHIYRQVVHGKEGSILLVTGQQVDYSVIASQAGATLNNLMSHAQELVAKLRSLQFDLREFVLTDREDKDERRNSNTSPGSPLLNVTVKALRADMKKVDKECWGELQFSMTQSEENRKALSLERVRERDRDGIVGKPEAESDLVMLNG
ncbi:hypothetical protein ASZ78_016678 [Callipepla squamata]|uniref:NR LBD domain-containing protein n=1 Tax=Callipepla squamata TaxID=9009 RepID=A0A226NLP9_CALSU|nr:hypothetical protein ASZ78_016678 [Callipepla squamata]